MKLSIVIPCHNEAENIKPMYDTLIHTFEQQGFLYEIIYINDGSKDTTWTEIQKVYKQSVLEKKGEKVLAVNFSRNFGKEAAMLAGLKHTSGEFAAIIDGDLQQSPELILEMLKILEDKEEFDCVAAYQDSRDEGKGLNFWKTSFYKMMNKTSDTTFYVGASDFRTFRRPVIDAIISLPEYFRFSKGIFSWVGFETYYLPYKAEKRQAGSSNWSFWGLVKYAIEGFVSFTTFPLRIATFLGAFTSAMAIFYLIIVIIQKLAFSIDIPGYPTIIVLILFLGGVQLLILGIIGEYLARIYIQSKNRPIYIEKNILDSDKGERNES